jgi:predicted nucleic acid-binding protein
VIVVDANVIVYWLIEGEYTALARQLYDQEPVWIVPTLCQHELANVITSYVKHGAVDIADVPVLWRGVDSLIGEREFDVDPGHAIALAVEKDLSAYDAQYLYLAMSMDIPLITQDKRLIRSADSAFSIMQFLNQEP